MRRFTTINDHKTRPVRALHKIFSDVLGAGSSQLGVIHDLFSVELNFLLAVQAAVSVGGSFKLNIGLNIYLRSFFP